MSHFTTIKTEIYDLDVLKQTLSELRLEFEENVKRQAGLNQKEVGLAVHFDPILCIGFKRNPGTKAYEIRAEKEVLQKESVKKAVERIRQEYAYRKVLQGARARGFALTQEERLKTGAIKLTLRKVA
jgi:hypothetical protein